jgi:hypothetical protein
MCSGDCAPPTTTAFLGDLVLAVETYAGPSGAPLAGDGPGWWTVRDGTFAAADAEDLPPAVQLDTNETRGSATPGTSGARPEVFLQLATDRPVTVTVSSLGWDTPGVACALRPQTVSTLSTRHSFHWDGACFGVTYYLQADLTDADGRTTHAGVGGEVFFPAIVSTDPVPTSAFDVDLTVTPKAGLRFWELGYSVGGVSSPLFSRADDACRDRPIRTVTTLDTVPGFRTVTVAEPLYIGISGQGDRGEDCDERFSVDLSGYVPLEAVLDGPQTLHFEDDDVSVDVTVRVHGAVPLTP